MLICAAGPRPATMRLALSGTQGLRSDRHRYRLRWPRTTKVSTSPAPAPLIIALGLVQSRQPPTAPTSNLHSARRNPPRIPSRGFLHWRLSDAGPKPRCSPRRPSSAGIRNPSQLAIRKRTQFDVCFVPIVLQKSFCIVDRKFFGPHIQLSSKHVRDLIAK